MSKHRFITVIISVVALVATGLGISPQSVSAWQFPNTRALVLSGFSGNGPGIDYVFEGDYSTRIDANDNVIVLGRTSGTAQVNPSDATQVAGNNGDWVHYLAKYSSSGNLTWMVQWSFTPSELQLATFELTSAGEIVIGGTVSGSGDLDPTTSGTQNVSVADRTAVVLKLSADGQYMWHRLFSTSLVSSATAMDIANDGSVIVGGGFEGTIDFDGPGGAAGLSLVSGSGRRADGFVVSLNSAGVEQWAAHLSGPIDEYVLGVGVDANGNIVAVSSIKGTTSAIPGDGGSTTFIDNNEANQGTVGWGMSSTGATQWLAIVASGVSEDEIPVLTLTRSNGQTLVYTRRTSGDRALYNLDTSGTVTNTMSLATYITSMVELPGKKVLIGGLYSGTQDVDPTSGTDIKTSTGNDALLIFLTESLAYEKSEVFTFTGNQNVASVATDSFGGWVMTGYSAEPVTLTFGEGTFTPTTGADSMLFIVRFDANGSVNFPPASAPTTLSYVPGNKKVTLQWTVMSNAVRYVITNSAGTTVCDTTSTSCEVTGLRNGRLTTFSVVAYNRGGLVSTTATSVRAMAGFTVGISTAKVRKKVALLKIVSTPSKGTITWKVTSGSCKISGKRLVMPTKPGKCRLQMRVAKKRPYPAMSTTVVVSVTRR